MSASSGAPSAALADRPGPLGRRGAVVLATLLAAVLGALALGLGPGGLVPSAGGLALAGDFLSAALRPAFDYELLPRSEPPPPAFLARVWEALARTLAFAAAGLSLALAAAVPLGCLASEVFWSDANDGRDAGKRGAGRRLRLAVRAFAAGLRSVHELLWAVVFLAAVGTSSAAAVLAIALPYAGTLTKVFADMLDEAPRDSGHALRAAGVARTGVFLFAILPRALPDMAAYAFYRFECAVRSSAVLGFFGFETLGYYLRLAFENLHYREVWTYLYALIAVVLLLEAWSGLLRRRFVA